jgi:hypothetical protein
MPEQETRSSIIMKIRPVVSIALFAISLACHAQEPNPFVSPEPEKEVPTDASGDAFVNVSEQIVVPAELLDAWLEKNPMTKDASALRAVVQTWIGEGKASLDHTAVSTGTSGRSFSNHSMWEQVYATEYEPPEPGEWPVPTAFETRNLGYTTEGNAGSELGAMVIRAKMDYCGMLPHRAWSELAEKTRQPDDVFIPRFRSIEIKRDTENAGNQDPFAAPATITTQDPFAEQPKVPDSAEYIRFIPGVTYLAGRADNNLPDSDAEKSAVNPPRHEVRLFFFRGVMIGSAAAEKSYVPDSHHVSAKLIRVDHRTFSDWLTKTGLEKAPNTAWAAAQDWQKDGKAEVTCHLTAVNSAGSSNSVQNIVEEIYPTEWEPGDRIPAADGKPSYTEFSTASAFETRNVGCTLQTEVIADPKKPLLQVVLERVAKGGKSVHHRILRDGEWKTDVTFPVFTSNVWNTEIRMKRGEWSLIGSGSDIDAKGRLDPNHSVLAFVRVE